MSLPHSWIQCEPPLHLTRPAPDPRVHSSLALATWQVLLCFKHAKLCPAQDLALGTSSTSTHLSRSSDPPRTPALLPLSLSSYITSTRGAPLSFSVNHADFLFFIALWNTISGTDLLPSLLVFMYEFHVGQGIDR